MDIAALTEFISDLLEKIYYLAEASQKKCQTLNDVENTITKCKQTLKLCSRIQKNCIYFEKELIQEADKYNIVLRGEESDTSRSISDTSVDASIKNLEVNKEVDSTEDVATNEKEDSLIISLKFHDIVETVNVPQVNDVDVSKFWLDLKKFIEIYLSSQGSNNDGEENKQSCSTQTENDSQYIPEKKMSTDDDPVLREIREIFGSDLEINQSQIDENNREIIEKFSNNEQSKQILRKTLNAEKSNKNEQIIKILGDIVVSQDSMSNPMEAQGKKGEGVEKAVEDVDVLEVKVSDKSDQQRKEAKDKEPTIHKEKSETVETEGSAEDKSEENVLELSVSDLEITASLKDDFASILNEDFHDKENSQQTQSKIIELCENSCESSISVDTMLTTVDVAQAADVASRQGTDDIVLEHEKELAQNESPSTEESSKAPTSRNISGEDSASEDAETTQKVISRNIVGQVEASEVETFQSSTSGIIGEQNAEDPESIQNNSRNNKVAKDLERNQLSTSRNIEEDEADLKLSQTTSPTNVEEVKDLEVKCTSRNIQQQDAEDPESMQTITSINTETVKDQEDVQISTSRNIQQQYADDPESTQITISTNIENAKDLEDIQINTSRNIQQEDAEDPESTQKTISTNIEKAKDPEDIQINTSKNIQQEDADPESTQITISTIIEKAKDPEDIQINTSKNIQQEDADPESTQITISTNIEKAKDPEDIQINTSKNIQQEDAEDAESTQITISTNIEKAKDLEDIQMSTSRNIQQEDAEDPDSTQINFSTNIEKAKDLEDIQISTSSNVKMEDTVLKNRISTPHTDENIDEQSSQKSIKVIKDPDSPRKRQFLSILGLAKCDDLDQPKETRDSLMDIFVRGGCEEGGGVKHLEDEEVADALKYFQELDSSSESLSVKSFRTDSLFQSESDESINLSADSQSEKEKGSRRRSKRLMRFNAKQKIENVMSERESSSEKVPKLNKSVEGFVSKDCYVKIKRLNIHSSHNSDEEDKEHSDSEKVVVRDCFVRLEYPRVLRVSSDSEDDVNSLSNDDGEVDRLCNISSLKRKRKKEGSPIDSMTKKKRDITKIKRKRRKINLSGSDTSDLTGFSSVSDDEIGYQRGGIFGDEFEIENKMSSAVDPNELLTEIVCHTIHASSSSDSDSNEEIRPRAKLKNSSSIKKVKKDISREESWRDDPLLTGALNLNSETTNKANSNKHKKRRRRSSDNSNGSDCGGRIKKTKDHKKLDANWRSDDSFSQSSSGDEFQRATDTNGFHKTKIKSILSDNSDIEFVDTIGTPSKTSVISLDSDDDHDKKPGRRNILSVLSSAQLTEETQKAAKEEEERVLKLQMRDQMRISPSETDTEDCLILDTSSEAYSLTVDPALTKRMFPHQVEGVKFMWDACYLSLDSLETFEGTGCILAHNMGLGKTFQVITLVHTLFSHSITNTKHVLVVCPLSTVSGWFKEFNTALKIAANKTHINIINIQSSDDSDSKFAEINKWKTRGGVLIIGYEAFEKLSSQRRKSVIRTEFLRKALVSPGPDLVVCDEGHLLKNGKALRTQALMEIRTKRRIVLTGTPLQNNLTEYYYMVQFVKPNLLGTKREFNRQFGNPIMNGQYEDSDEADITIMKKRTHVLHRILKNTVQRYEATELQKYIDKMKDYALFIQLHPVQEQLYRYYIEMAKGRKDTTNSRVFKNFFSDYQISKFICSHPQLLYTMETQNARSKKNVIKEKDIISEEPEVQEVEGIPDGWWKAKCPEDIKTSIEFGTKLQVMMAIIEEAEKIGEKVLIFTSSLVELSSIEYFLKLKGTSSCLSWRPRSDYFRMDGTVPPSVRTQMCDRFNDKNNRKLRVFLMSHKVGGLGLNLVAANRVILLGANFNPSHDSQSIFRAYRFGQEKTVYIYRLLSMGTMEEKIYNRCVTKLAIASRVIDKHQIARHYKNLDLEDLYTIGVDLALERSVPSKPEDNLLSNILLKFDCIYKYHQHQKLLENRPDEDLNEEDKIKAWEEFKLINEPNKNPAGNTSSTNKVSTPDKMSTLADIVSNRWNQLNQSGPSRVDGAKDPLATLGNLDLTLNNFMSSAGTHFIANMSFVDDWSQNMVPNPANLNKNVESNNKDVRQNSSSNDILQNVSNNPGVTKKHETKKKTTSMGPNPFVLNKVANKKENLSAKKGIMPLRKTSSDDFQKPTVSKVLKSNLSSRKGKSKAQDTSRSRSLVSLTRVPNRSRRNVSFPANSTPIDVDDDDVIVIDSPEKRSPSNDRKRASPEMTVKDALQMLDKNKISVSYSTKKPTKKDSKEDAFVIEIL